jgi:hypothetical protein
MKKYSLIMVLVIMSFVFANSQARANLVSTFNIDKEGWRVFNRAPGGVEGDLTEYVGSYQSLGGNPGGFFQGADSGIGNTGFFVSPIDWAGNWSQYIWGTLQFDIKLIQQNGTPSLFPAYDVLIYTDADHYAYSKFGVDPQLGSWTNYQLQLIASNFDVVGGSFDSIMSNVAGLRIIGEFIYGPETVGLDNVMVSAVPEPTTMLLLGSGLLGLAGYGRKKFFKK